jgi:hypothetical protein
MTPNQFAQKICKGEGKLKQVNIAQVSEILKVANQLTGGVLYGIIKMLPA